MSHLTDEQIERIIEDPECRDRHAGECGLCRERLEDALAVRRRLRRAFESVHADAALKDRVLASIRAAQPKPAPGRLRIVLRRVGPSLAAAAALILIAFTLTMYVAPPRQAVAGPAELAQIHQSNLMPHAGLHGSDDPARVAGYLKQELGFVPTLPKLGGGMALRGCCVAHFRNRPVGSYVLETDRGIMSIIVLRDRPDSLEFAEQTTYRGRTYHTGAFARNKMAAVEINGYTYTAVGETDTQWLVELLSSLLD
jgi:hypothetical protein